MSLGQIYGTGYEVILVAFSGIVTAQIIKFLLHLIIKRSMDLRLFTTTGGMPSSHSAGVMGLSTAVGDEGGFAPDLRYAKEVLTLIVEAISQSGYNP